MRRRAFIVGLFGVAARPSAATAEDARIAVLGPAEQPRYADLVEGIRQGLAALGYAPEQVGILEAAVARGDQAAAAAATRQVRAQGASVIFAIGSEMARPARRADPDVPIVFATPGDPVASGLVASLARPGGNMTGVVFEYPELSSKRLELIRDVIGDRSRVLVVADSRDASSRQGLAAVRASAPSLGMLLVELDFTSRSDIERAAFALRDVAALLVIPGGAPTPHRAILARAALDARIPAVFPAAGESSGEVLATYGASDVGVARDAARLIDRILRGTPAGDLPVERPTRIDLVINQRTARAIGLVIPPGMLARADAVIE